MKFVAISSLRIDKRFAAKLPPTAARELQALAADIAKRGVLVDLVVTAGGLLLDGHRRLEAARLVGLTRVPVKQLQLEGSDWHEAVSIALNLFRRQLNEAQRAALGSSLLRIERDEARKRQREGGRRGGKSQRSGKSLPRCKPEPPPKRAAEVAAKAVGVSRRALERVERIKKEDPALAARMIDGKISIAAAYSKVKVAEIRERGEAESTAPEVISDLQAVPDRYRCIYIDPPWEYRDSGARGAAARHYATMPLSQIADLPVPAIAHPEGAHLWLWTTWPMI